MSGYLRFALAALVILFHAGLKPEGMYIGVISVYVFYMLSGFAMSGLWSKQYKFGKFSLRFYAERILRIYPQYLFYMLLTILLTFVLGWWLPNSQAQKLTPNIICDAFTLIPYSLGIYIRGLVQYNPMGITTSLSNEELFYLIAPLIFISKKFAHFLFLFAGVVFCCSTWGLLTRDVFSYYFQPGPAVFMILGHWIYERNWLSLKIAIGLLAINCSVLLIAGKEFMGLNPEICVSLFLGIPLIILMQKNYNLKGESFFGSMSYGMFLSQTPILIILKHFKLFPHSIFWFGAVWLLSSSFLGRVSFMTIEAPTILFRRRFRPCTKTPMDLGNVK